MSDEIKKGLLGIVVDETTVSQVMPDINSLTYRGYAVQDLCEKCIFEEVAYLVLNGELPNKKQLRNFIKELPFELIEAARADGATEWMIYRKIILPLIIPAIAALGVLEFTFIWNDYFWALILSQGDGVKPVTVGLDNMRGQWVANYNLISAGSVIAALPPVIMFFLMQRHFINGLTFGAVKG